jgi:hypothetical protein
MYENRDSENYGNCSKKWEDRMRGSEREGKFDQGILNAHIETLW